MLEGKTHIGVYARVEEEESLQLLRQTHSLLSLAPQSFHSVSYCGLSHASIASMHSFSALALALLPAALAVELRGQSLNALFPRQSSFNIPIPCGTYEIGDPHPCETACGAGFLMCAPAGACFDNAGGDKCCENGRTNKCNHLNGRLMLTSLHAQMSALQATIVAARAAAKTA